jgi:hypothetical protein
MEGAQLTVVEMSLAIQAKLSVTARITILLLYTEHELWEEAVQNTINMATTRNSDTRHVNYSDPGYLMLELGLDISSLQLVTGPLKIKYKNPTIRFSIYDCHI